MIVRSVRRIQRPASTHKRGPGVALVGLATAITLAVAWQTFPSLAPLSSLSPLPPLTAQQRGGQPQIALTQAVSEADAPGAPSNALAQTATEDGQGNESLLTSIAGESTAAGAVGAVTEPPAPAPIRIPKPAVPAGPRRIGLQAGHWRTEALPDELRRLEPQTGTSWGGVTEWQLNLDTANRAAAILRTHGYEVDVLPTIVPPNYLADVFIALHADGDPAGAARGFKAAHGSRRGPYEDRLVQVLMEEYGRATGLPVDPSVSRNMLGYYAFAWSRVPYSAAAHTPAAILEMGFMTSGADRAVILQRNDLVVTGVVNSILRFLQEVPQGAAFAEDIVVPPLPPRPQGTPAPQGVPSVPGTTRQPGAPPGFPVQPRPLVPVRPS
jgi:hypothetical protein